MRRLARDRFKPVVAAEVAQPTWIGFVLAVWKRNTDHNLALLSAGVAFWGTLSLVPAGIAVVTIYGLVSDPADLTELTNESGPLPDTARALVSQQLSAIVSASSTTLGIGLVVALGIALWAVSGAVQNLLLAVAVAYGTTDRSGVVRRRARSLVLALAAVVFVVLAILLIAVIPGLLRRLDPHGVSSTAIGLGRWILLIVMMLVALAVLFALAPRPGAHFSWLTPGAALSTVIWVVASIGFSIYADNFSRYQKIYGTLAGVVVLMLWLWLTAWSVLLGAAVNGELEQPEPSPAA
jgi:membrane protein